MTEQPRKHRDPRPLHYTTQATSVTIPADVMVLFVHAPCPFCGTARGVCKHRRAA